MDALLNWIDSANDILWNTILLVMLCGTGIFYTLKLKFIQVRKFKEGLKIVFGSFSLSGKKRDNGEMTPFQAVATAIAAQVGTGNLTGAATALIGGGQNVFRPDEIHSAFTRDEMLREAPSAADGYITVPKTVQQGGR